MILSYTIKRFQIFLASVLAISSCVSAFASSNDSQFRVRIETPIARGIFRAGVGSLVSFELPRQNFSRSGFFLGRVVKPDGTLDSYLLLEPKTMNVFYVPAALVQIADHELESVLDPYPQQGGTCTGYAIDHFMIQTALDGFRGNGALVRTLSTEEGRTGLLADSINQYYLVLQHRFSIRGILDGYGKRFDFKCQNKIFSSAAEARGFLLHKLSQGQPVLISFNIGTQMRASPFDLMMMRPASYKLLDRRLWVPRKISERNGGGHAIVAASVFQLGDRPEVMVIDSDWSEPRIWDLNDYLDDRTAIQEVEFVTCS